MGVSLYAGHATHDSYWLIHGSLIIARFLAVEKGVGLCAGRIMREYIWRAMDLDEGVNNLPLSESQRCRADPDVENVRRRLC